MTYYRSYGGSSRFNSGPTFGDKLVCVFSYLTTGMVGFIWIIYSYVTHRTIKPFVKFHAYQSIFLSIIMYLFSIVFRILLSFVKIIPILGDLVLNIVRLITVFPIVFGYSILHIAILLLLLYLIYVSFKGEMGDIPWVSDNVKRMI